MKLGLLLSALFCLFAAGPAVSKELRVGMIGLDTSHVTAFTEILHNPESKEHVPGARVTAAFKGGSPDIESSWSRVEEYTKVLTEKHGVKIYDTIEEMCQHVDVVMLESVDGRPHLAQAKPVILAKKPLYIDKPMAISIEEVKEIFALAKEHGVPVFSSSSLRFAKGTQAVRNGSIGKVSRAETFSPCHTDPTHPLLYWYGIHGCESLFTVMGTGIETVKCGTTADGKLEVTGKWSGGRVGIYREGDGYGGKAVGEKGEAAVGSYDGYGVLVAEVIRFFQTGAAPVPERETLELFAFMTAAEESRKQNGAEVDVRKYLDAPAK